MKKERLEAKLYTTIDDAIKKIRKCHDESKNKPLLVGVHSPDGGYAKSYFCRKACNVLDPYRPGHCYKALVLNNPCFDSMVERNYVELKYLFYNIRSPCPINHEAAIDNWIRHWNEQIRPYTGRGIDVNVFIFNPNLLSPDLEPARKVFDIIIAYPNSAE